MNKDQAKTSANYLKVILRAVNNFQLSTGFRIKEINIEQTPHSEDAELLFAQVRITIETKDGEMVLYPHDENAFIEFAKLKIQ